MNIADTRPLFFLLGFLGLFSGASGCQGGAAGNDGRGLQRFEFSRQTLGQPLRLVMYVPDRNVAIGARDAVFSRLAEVEARLDARDPKSEVTHLSESAGGPWIPVSEDLFLILRKAVQFTEQTEGAYDVTTGAAVALWDQAAASGKPPTEEEVIATKALIGEQLMQMNAVDRSVRLLLPGMLIDLEPMDAGFAVDSGLWTLRRVGVRRAMIEMRSAGVAAAIGTPPGEAGWKTTVPFPSNKAKSTDVTLANDGVAWTPEKQPPVRVGNFSYSGLIDPETALPKASQPPRVMVIAPGAFVASGIRHGATLLGPGGSAFVKVNNRARVSFARPEPVR